MEEIQMFITEEYKGTSKFQLLIDLVRADEALATLIEHEYDSEMETITTIDTLDYQGIKCELRYLGYNGLYDSEYLDDDGYETDKTIFDEFSNIINGLCHEIQVGDYKIHQNKKYGFLDTI